MGWGLRSEGGGWGVRCGVGAGEWGWGLGSEMSGGGWGVRVGVGE